MQGQAYWGQWVWRAAREGFEVDWQICLCWLGLPGLLEVWISPGVLSSVDFINQKTVLVGVWI